MASTAAAIRTIGLSKSYGKRLAVDHLDLEVDRAELFGFLGPNGAGKTTTIRMALGLIAPTGGTVEILGLEVRSHRSQVLPRVGALVESPALYGYLSGRDNLRAVGNLLGGATEKRIDEVLEIVALKGRDRDRVRTYSMGMKQRLGLALALLNNPDVKPHRGSLVSTATMRPRFFGTVRGEAIKVSRQLSFWLMLGGSFVLLAIITLAITSAQHPGPAEE